MAMPREGPRDRRAHRCDPTEFADHRDKSVMLPSPPKGPRPQERGIGAIQDRHQARWSGRWQ